MTDEVLANAPEARTETGEIKDVSTPSPTPEPKSPEPEVKPAPEPTSTAKPKEGETLLTDEKKPEPAKAPDKYEDFKLPEGVELKGDQLTAAHALFKDLGLPQAEAQKLVDFHTAQMKAAAEGPAKAYSDMRADWQAKTAADPDIAKVSNDGKTGLDAVKVNVAKLYSAIGNEKLVNDFKEVMNLTGVGDHPAFINVLNWMSGRVTEGKHVSGNQPSLHGQTPGGAAKQPSAAQALYPNLP